MINKLIAAISTNLHTNYPDFKKYVEKVPQGFDEPCFFIMPLEPSERQVIDNRYFKSTQFVIQCFAEELSTLYDVADNLFYELEYIKVDDVLLRGTKPKFNVVDDVLSFFINYDFHYYRVPRNNSEEGFMEVLDLTVKVV